MINKDQIILKPQSGPQERFCGSSADIVIFGGAAGGGKTYGLLLEAGRNIEVPGYGAVLFRRTYAQVTKEGGLWDTSELIYPYLGGRAASHQWSFPSDTKIAMAHLQHEKHKYDWDGSQIPLIGFDELIHFTKSQFFYLLSRNRSTCPVRPYIRATTNPDADSWVADFIAWWINQETGYPIKERDGIVRYFLRVDASDQLKWFDTKTQGIRYAVKECGFKEDEAQYLIKSFTFILSTLYDNKILMEKDPYYLGNLQNLSQIERERLLHGNWKIQAAGGGIINKSWLRRMVELLPIKHQILKAVRYWDKGGTDEEEENSSGASYTASCLMLELINKQVLIGDITQEKLSAGKRENFIKRITAEDNERWEEKYQVGVEQEPGSGGKESANNTVRNLQGYSVYKDLPKGDKITRMYPFAAYAEQGNVLLLHAPWAEDYRNTLHNIRPGVNCDVGDATSGAFNQIAGLLKTKKGGVW